MEEKADSYDIGARYYEGRGVKVNKVEAAKWFRKAAEENHVTAQYSLAVCYDIGDGVIKDKTEAVKWFRKAAEQGSKLAQKRLIALKLESSTTAKQQGRYLDALADSEYCLELDPNYEPAITNKKNIPQAIVQNRETVNKPHIFSLSSIGSALLLPYSLTKKLVSFGLQFFPTTLWNYSATESLIIPNTLTENSVTSERQNFAGRLIQKRGSNPFQKNMREEEFNQVTEKESQLQVEIDHLRKALHEKNTLTDELERQTKNLDQERQQVRCLAESLDEQKQKTTTLEDDLAKTFLKIKSLKTSLEKQKKESQIRSSRIEQLEKDLTKHQRKSDASENFILKQTRQINKLSKEVEYLQEQIEILQQDLEQGNALKKQYDLQTQELYKNSRRISQLEEELKEKKHKIAALEEQIRITKNQASAQQVKLEKADGLRRKIEEETNLNKQLSAQISNLEKILREQIDKTVSLKHELEPRDLLISQLKQVNDQLSSQLQTFLIQFRENYSLRELCNAQAQQIHFLQGELARSYQHPLVLQPTVLMEGEQVAQLKEQLRQM